MKFKITFVLLFVYILFFADENTGLLKPLMEVTYCTSSFGEYRFSHFHGGVDFSTQGEEGEGVLAIGDGFIRRVRREASGYGRVIYLDLIDGRTAVYGHLIRFSRQLGIEQKLIDECRKKETSFPGDIYFDPPIKVKKGEIIGYSGQLGSGSPHLHFEIRRGDILLNPFYEGISYPDMSKPVIDKILFVPCEEGAKVNDSLFPVEGKISLDKNGELSISTPVKISKDVAIYLSTYDHIGSKEYKTMPSKIECEIDSRKVFDLNFKGVSLLDYKMSPYLYDIVDGKIYLVLKNSPKLKLQEINGDINFRDVARSKVLLKVSNISSKSTTLSFEVLSSQKDEVVDEIPFSSFSILKEEIYQNGIGLLLTPFKMEGKSNIFINGVQTQFYANRRGDGKWEVLIPKSFLKGKLCQIKIGNTPLSGFYTSSFEFQLLRFIVKVPDDILCKIKEKENILEIISAPNGKIGLVKLGGFPKNNKKEAIFTNKYLFNYLTGSTKNLFRNNRYEILEDNEPPKFGKIFKKKIPRLGEDELWIEVKDDLSGINAKSMKIFIDGKRVYPDWDGDKSSIRIDLFGLKSGEHTVSGTILDGMGNEGVLSKSKFLR